MKNEPAYFLASVDNALVLATILRTEGSITVTDAARRLSVAPSTAHRLLSMLVYRDFAVRDSARLYRTGPALAMEAHHSLGTGLLREISAPALEALARRTGESVNLVVRVGEFVHFIASWESTKPLRVGSREGMTFPAHLTSGGLALLALLGKDDVDDLYSAERWADREGRPDLAQLRRDLAGVRRTGIALQRNRSEAGVTAVGMALTETGMTPAALSVAMPTVRYEPRELERWARELHVAAGDITAAAQRSLAL